MHPFSMTRTSLMLLLGAQDLERSQTEIDSLHMDYTTAQRDLRAAKDLVLRVTQEKEALEERLSEAQNAAIKVNLLLTTKPL